MHAHPAGAIRCDAVESGQLAKTGNGRWVAWYRPVWQSRFPHRLRFESAYSEQREIVSTDYPNTTQLVELTSDITCSTASCRPSSESQISNSVKFPDVLPQLTPVPCPVADRDSPGRLRSRCYRLFAPYERFYVDGYVRSEPMIARDI